MMKHSPTSSGVNTPKDLSGSRVKKFQNGWTEEQEILLAKWSDYASCYRWLHDRTEKQLSWCNNWITIPVIVLSTITGTASVGLNGLVGNSESAQKYAQITIGLVSISTGILTTLGNYFRFAQNSECHRVCAVSWSKFNRLIAVELAQKPDDRLDSLDFIGLCRQDLDRLIEQSPQIPDNIIDSFEKEFEHQEDLSRPDICNNIEHTTVYNNSKTRMRVMVAEMAMNLRHKKKMLREEIIPDLDERMKTMIDKSLKEFEDKIKEKLNKEDQFAFMSDVRKRLGDVVNAVADIHVTEPTPRSSTGENIVIDIIGQQRKKA